MKLTITLTGPGADEAADEIGQALEDLRDSGAAGEFEADIESGPEHVTRDTQLAANLYGLAFRITAQEKALNAFAAHAEHHGALAHRNLYLKAAQKLSKAQQKVWRAAQLTDPELTDVADFA